jgi:hypothetical protein
LHGIHNLEDNKHVSKLLKKKVSDYKGDENNEERLGKARRF